jgi:site-specific DNA-methyltransferase (adenine-specific)
MVPRRSILIGDALDRLRSLPEASVDCVMTSPPYFALRDYGVSGQIGMERHVDEWVTRLTAVFDEVARVLKPTGGLWLNLADSYSRHPRYGAPVKGLLLAPERLALSLASRGWLLRNKVVWSKPNPMPTSVKDRFNASHDFVYFFTRQSRYFFDLDAVREPHRSSRTPTRHSSSAKRPEWIGPLAGTRTGLDRLHAEGLPGHHLGKNPGDVWSIATRSYRGAHFATFPEQLVLRPLLTTCPERVCARCRKPWVRTSSTRRLGLVRPTGAGPLVRRYPSRWTTLHERGDFIPCGCGAGTQPGLVLDPFIGTGTVGVVAERHGRDWIGIELSAKYAAMAKERIAKARAPSNPRRRTRLPA